MRNIATLRSPVVPMMQKDYDALDAWLIEYGNDVVSWDTVTRMEALSWIRSLRESPSPRDKAAETLRKLGWPAPDSTPQTAEQGD